MKRTDWAYLAGIVDGEGSIFIATDATTIVLSISTTSKKLKKRLLDMGMHYQGMKIHALPAKESSIHSKLPLYHLRVYASNAEKLLTGMLPYLSIKKRKAELALKFRKLQEGNHKHRFVGVPRREKSLRERYATLIREA